MSKHTMVHSCAAYNCTNRSYKGSPISFHAFPKVSNLREAWIQAIRRYNYNPSNNARLCSKHFKSSDYVIISTGVKLLKRGAIPSIFNFGKVVTARARNYGKHLLPSSSSATLPENQIKVEEPDNLLYDLDENDQLVKDNLLSKGEIKIESEITIDGPQIQVYELPTNVLQLNNARTTQAISMKRKRLKPAYFHDIDKEYLKIATPRKMKEIYLLAAAAIRRQTSLIKKLKQNNYRSECKLKSLLTIGKITNAKRKYIYDTSEL